MKLTKNQIIGLVIVAVVLLILFVWKPWKTKNGTTTATGTNGGTGSGNRMFRVGTLVGGGGGGSLPGGGSEGGAVTPGAGASVPRPSRPVYTAERPICPSGKYNADGSCYDQSCAALSASLQSVAARLVTSRNPGDRDILKSLAARYNAAGCSGGGGAVATKTAGQMCWDACQDHGGSSTLCHELCDWLSPK